MKALSADRQAALKAGLEDMQSKLSPEGWQTVERFLKGTAGMGVGSVIGTPLSSPRER
jgi:hypothetical protein